MKPEFDVCVIGSGAGGGPVALTLAEAGYSVVVLEKGPWFTEKDFYKDEIEEVTAVPEPTTTLLWGLGLLTLVERRRLRRVAARL